MDTSSVGSDPCVCDELLWDSDIKRGWPISESHVSAIYASAAIV